MVLEALCKAQEREDFALNDAAVISLALDLRDARRAIQRAMDLPDQDDAESFGDNGMSYACVRKIDMVNALKGKIL